MTRVSTRPVRAFLESDRVCLRPVERTDLAQLAAWRNDPRIHLRTREWRPLTMAHQERWWSRITDDTSKEFMFVVEQAGNASVAVGVVGLCHWHPAHRVAESSFYIAPGHQRKGYATAALRLLHEWGFAELDLARVFAEVFAMNDASIHLLQTLGYQKEGVLRNHVYRLGRRWDSILMGLLREEWKQ